LLRISHIRCRVLIIFASKKGFPHRETLFFYPRTIEFLMNIVFFLLMLRLKLRCITNNTNNIQEGFMIVRHLLLAGLFATASIANAGTVEASSAPVQPASFSTSGATGASQSSIAGPAWSSVSRMGDRTMDSTVLLSQSGPSTLASVSSSSLPTTIAVAASTDAAQIAAPAPAEMVAVAGNADAGANAAITAPVLLADVAAVPEPATGMLMLAGLLGAGFMSRRRK
jgi:hypothetical protein